MQRSGRSRPDVRAGPIHETPEAWPDRPPTRPSDGVATRRYVSLGAPGLPDPRVVSLLHSVSSKAHNVGISPAEGDHRVEQAEPGKAGAVPAGRSPYLGKRLLDVVVGLVLSILTLPIILVLATISAVKFRCLAVLRAGAGGPERRVVPLHQDPVAPGRRRRPTSTRSRSTITASRRVGAASCVGSISTSCRSSGTWSAAR